MKLSIFYAAAVVTLVAVHCRGQDEIVEPQLLSEDQQPMWLNSEGDSVMEERKFCKISKKCMSKNGRCIPKDQECDGEIIKKGCKKTKNCRNEYVCCAPDVAPPGPTCPACPVVTPEPCPSTGTISNSILEWRFVDEDYFVAINTRLTWLEAQDFCTNFGLELYHPKNIMNVARHLNANIEPYYISTGFGYHVGGRGNGTHNVWLSGEVVSRDEPWHSTSYNNFRTTTCLSISTHPTSMVEREAVLRSWPNSCNGIDWILPSLCGTPHDYTLTWHSVGEDKFARYYHKMDWEDSRALCKQFGLDLYQAKDVFAVSAYLNGLSSYNDNILKEYYWLGAKRDGDKVFWLSGEEIPQNSSVWATDPIKNAYYYCVYCFADSRYADRPIMTWMCDATSAYPLCG